MGEINQEIDALRNEVSALRTQVNATDDWATSVFVALEAVLPFLLRGHPQVQKVRDLLQAQARSFEDLQSHPKKEGDVHGHASRLEAGKMLYYQLALLDVWPGVDSKAVIRQTLARAQDGKRPLVTEQHFPVASGGCGNQRLGYVMLGQWGHRSVTVESFKCVNGFKQEDWCDG